MSRKGFLIGTSNTWIEQQSTKFELHDVLVNLETGKVFARKQRANSLNKKKSSLDLDKQLIKNVLEGISKGNGEAWVRRQFQDHIQRIIDTAFGVEYYESTDQVPFGL